MQSSHHSQLSGQHYYLHIYLNNIEIRHNQKFQDVYFSFVFKQKFHFSSAINSKTSYINDDFFIYIQNQEEVPETIKVQRWERHMILLEHQIDITQIKGRNSTKKKVETKQNQIISLTFNLHTSQQIKFLNYFVPVIAQHYLKIFKVSLQDQIKQTQEVLSYFQIATKQQKYIVPVINSQLIIQLPAQFQISYFKNNQLFGKSDWFNSKQFNNKLLQIGLYNQKGSYISKMKLHLQWGTNLVKKKIQSNILYEAHELCIYDIQVKFQNFAELSGVKLKFVYGTKAFEINGQLNHRIVQFQRIVYIILKSEDQEVAVYCEKNNKIIAQAKFNTAEMISYKIVLVKKQFTDPVSHRPLGYVKFTCQKAKNLSLPSSNNFWKQCNRKKNSAKLMLQIQQLSVYSQSKKSLLAIVKTQKEQYLIEPILNFSQFQMDCLVHEPLALSIQQQSSVYILIKQKQEQNNPENEFLGIAAINYEELRLGVNSLKIPFYKNQVETLYANCIINKAVPYPFIKGFSQPQIGISPHTKTISISVQIEKIQFYPYFLTYQYQKKDGIYCILEIGKVKKVIVLQPAKYQSLHFQVASGSDTLNYGLVESDFIKAKLTFLVSQLGQDQEIYGYTLLRLKTSQFVRLQSEKFNNLQIKNDYGICIGIISLLIKKGMGNASQMFSNRQIKKLKNDMIKVGQSIQKVERNISKNKSLEKKKSVVKQKKGSKKQLPVRYVSKKKHQPNNLQLPKIREQKLKKDEVNKV